MAAGYTCPVCDYPKLSEPPRSEFGGGSFEICPSCGFQFGVNDDGEGISYETWRRRWEAAGMPWSSIAISKPDSWEPVAAAVAPAATAPSQPAAESDPPAGTPPPKATGKSDRSDKSAKKPAAAKAGTAKSSGKRQPAPKQRQDRSRKPARR